MILIRKSRSQKIEEFLALVYKSPDRVSYITVLVRISYKRFFNAPNRLRMHTFAQFPFDFQCQSSFLLYISTFLQRVIIRCSSYEEGSCIYTHLNYQGVQAGFLHEEELDSDTYLTSWLLGKHGVFVQLFNQFSGSRSVFFQSSWIRIPPTETPKNQWKHWQ